MTPDTPPPRAVEQGPGPERLPLPPMAEMNDAQRAAAQALIDGPRKAVYGPFVPLMRTPALLDRVAALGEALRFGGTLDTRVRELVTAAAAAHVGNQFEWVMHQPLAVAAGVSAEALEAIRLGRRPPGLATDEQVAIDVATELMQRHSVSEPTWTQACATFGEPGVVELTTLVGYFVMVSWVMNAAHTPSRPASVVPLPAHPL